MALVMSAQLFIPAFLLLEFDRLSWSIMTINIVGVRVNLSIYKSFCGNFRGWMTEKSMSEGTIASFSAH